MSKKHLKKSIRSTRRTLTDLILEKVAEAGMCFVDSFFPAKYPEARMWRNLLGYGNSYKFERKTFTSILSRLKAEGLVAVRKDGRKSLWNTTAKGNERFVRLRDGANIPKSDGIKRLVVFDIPEKERAKRRWLRGELIALEYRQLQKSVWLGEVPLPVDFIGGLDALRLNGKVHIFRIESDGAIV